MSGDRNRYDGRNKYQRTDRAGPRVANAGGTATGTNLPVPAPPPIDVAGSGDWEARRPPEAAIYLPSFGGGRLVRTQGKRLAEDFHIAAAVANAATNFYKSAEQLEAARQDLELAHQRRSHVPIRATLEHLHLQQQLAKSQAAFADVQESSDVQRIDHARQRQLDADDYEIARLQREAEKRDLAARIATADAQLSYAANVGQRRGEAELARVEAEAFRHQAEAEGERRRVGEERRKSRETGPADDMPAPLARHLATEREVRRSTNEPSKRAQAIRDRVAAQGRDLTDSEVEEIDMLENAASAAEASIRRGGASDFEA